MILYGASGHAKVIIEILENSGIPIDGLFDDNPEIKSLYGYTCTQFSERMMLNNKLIISIGDNKIRKLITEKMGDVKYGIAIDSTSILSKRATIGLGSVIMPGVIINSGTLIGCGTLVRTREATIQSL